jgi:3-oxoadipate enol-lactonase
MKVDSGYAEVNGTRLYYEVAGRGPPVVLIHGFTLDTRMWDDQFEVFAQRYKVVRYDVRGFGKSALPVLGERYTHADDLMALLKYLEIAKTHVVGLSMGGEIAINFTLEHPEVTQALVLVDSGLGGFQGTKEWNETFTSILSRAKKDGVHVAKEVWLQCQLFQPAFKKVSVASRLEQMVSGYSGWHFLNNDPIRSFEPSAIERLEEISALTLVIIGEGDLPGCHEIADILNQKIRNVRKIVLQGVGHMSNMEAPNEFNEAVLRFLADN